MNRKQANRRFEFSLGQLMTLVTFLAMAAAICIAVKRHVTEKPNWWMIWTTVTLYCVLAIAVVMRRRE